MHLNEHPRSLSHHSWTSSCDQIWSCATSVLKLSVHSEEELLRKYRFTSPSKSRRRFSLQPSTAVLQFLQDSSSQTAQIPEQMVPLMINTKIWFPKWALGRHLVSCDRIAHCWVTPSEERPSDKFSKSCHQTAKNVLQIALAQTIICRGSGKQLPFTVTWMEMDPLKHSG